MKKVLSWLLVITMMVTAMALPMAVYAEETNNEGTTEDTTGDVTTGDDTTTEETTPTSNQVEYFNFDFENGYDSATKFPIAKTTEWVDNYSTGYVVDGMDGKAFKYTGTGLTGNTGGYSTYKPASAITSGKFLISMDVSMSKEGTVGAKPWTWTLSSGQAQSNFFPLRVANTGLWSTAAGGTSGAAKTKLVDADSSDILTSVDVLVDVGESGSTKYYYVNGKLKETTAIAFTSFATNFKIYFNNNIYMMDNFKMVLNPDKQYTFSQKGEVTTQSEYVTVRFSDTVYLDDITDFIITDANGETAATVTEIEQINGKFYNLKLSKKLDPGTYNLTLADTTLTSVIAGTTSSNTTSEFTVKPEYTYFDIDFEDYTTSGAALTYYNTFNQYGSFTLENSNTQSKSNTYGFAGDDGYGITCSSSGTRILCFTPSQPITSGKVVISYDAAFDSTRQTSRQQMSYVGSSSTSADDAATNGCVLTYGIYGDVSVIGGADKTGHYSAEKTKSYENNKAYRWDTVINMDTKTITNYCDGVQFNKVTANSTFKGYTDIKNVYFRFKPAITFFDNYKMTVNVEDFGYTATDIDTYSSSTIVNFDDTMVLADSDLIFTDPEGNTVTPVAITKISPRKYKVMLPDLMEGTYKVELAEGKTSAIGNTAKIEYATFNVAERPAQTFYATNLGFTDIEGGVTLSATVSNIAESVQKAFLIIGVYKDRVLEECIADVFEIEAGATDIEKTVTLTTDKDLSEYTVRGFVWNRETFAPLIVSVTK